MDRQQKNKEMFIIKIICDKYGITESIEFDSLEEKQEYYQKIDQVKKQRMEQREKDLTESFAKAGYDFKVHKQYLERLNDVFWDFWAKGPVSGHCLYLLSCKVHTIEEYRKCIREEIEELSNYPMEKGICRSVAQQSLYSEILELIS